MVLKSLQMSTKSRSKKAKEPAPTSSEKGAQESGVKPASPHGDIDDCGPCNSQTGPGSHGDGAAKESRAEPSSSNNNIAHCSACNATTEPSSNKTAEASRIEPPHPDDDKSSSSNKRIADCAPCNPPDEPWRQGPIRPCVRKHFFHTNRPQIVYKPPIQVADYFQGVSEKITQTRVTPHCTSYMVDGRTYHTHTWSNGTDDDDDQYLNPKAIYIVGRSEVLLPSEIERRLVTYRKNEEAREMEHRRTMKRDGEETPQDLFKAAQINFKYDRMLEMELRGGERKNWVLQQNEKKTNKLFADFVRDREREDKEKLSNERRSAEAERRKEIERKKAEQKEQKKKAKLEEKQRTKEMKH